MPKNRNQFNNKANADKKNTSAPKVKQSAKTIKKIDQPAKKAKNNNKVAPKITKKSSAKKKSLKGLANATSNATDKALKPSISIAKNQYSNSITQHHLIKMASSQGITLTPQASMNIQSTLEAIQERLRKRREQLILGTESEQQEAMNFTHQQDTKDKMQNGDIIFDVTLAMDVAPLIDALSQTFDKDGTQDLMQTIINSVSQSQAHSPNDILQTTQAAQEKARFHMPPGIDETMQQQIMQNIAKICTTMHRAQAQINAIQTQNTNTSPEMQHLNPELLRQLNQIKQTVAKFSQSMPENVAPTQQKQSQQNIQSR